MKLKIGDKIYLYRYSTLFGFEIIIKITPTTVKSKNYIFSKEINDDGYVRIKGQGNWTTVSGYIANKEIDKKWEEMKIKHWFDNEKDNFNIQQIKEIKKMLDR